MYLKMQINKQIEDTHIKPKKNIMAKSDHEISNNNNKKQLMIQPQVKVKHHEEVRSEKRITMTVSSLSHPLSTAP